MPAWLAIGVGMASIDSMADQWLTNVKKMSQNAVWGFLAASQENVQKMSGKCPGAGVGAEHFSSANPSTRTFSKHFLDIFLGGCQEAPKGILGQFFDIF